MSLPQKQQNKIIKGIHEGNISLIKLPEEIMIFNYNEIMNAVEQGFGGGVGDFKSNPAKAERAFDYENNIFSFSSHKAFHETKDLTFAVFNPDRTKRSFKEFREIALSIDNTYNTVYLKTEQDTAFGMSQGADAWFDIQQDKEIFPLLQYVTAADERVRPEHADWDGIVRPVDDDFWATRMPLNGYGCRCRTIKLSEGSISDLKGVPQNSSEIFNVNPGKVSYVFNPKKHPYFKVERGFKERSKNNFGFKKPKR